jgi:hypothetical protein
VSGVDSSKIIILTATWVLMLLWLAFVFVSGVVAFRKWQKTEGSAQVQMLYLWIGAAVVFTGDFLHTIAATISTYTDNATGPIHVLGGIFEFRTFAMFFDALVFMVYYTLWALFIVIRYQQGTFKSYDKISISLAAAAIVLILPGAVPNALGIYTLEYDIAIWAPHIILFMVFGVMTVYKLISCSRCAVTQTADPVMQQQERALFKTGIGFAFSFLFFFLSLALLPVNELFAMFMIPKTFAYMFAFYHLIKGVLLSTAEVPADVR